MPISISLKWARCQSTEQLHLSFSYTGVDIFGPLAVTIRSRQEKLWVVLFTCLSVCAVHFKLVTDIHSDNGTNFVREANNFLDHDRIVAYLALLGVKWIFNTPANSSEGGAWESLF
ncbi:hypothetical protein CVS40_11094 [Lucilia cuprina]|nr:hypothetical protein CVS40_11094 [Lucilia cuprina]